MLEQLHIHNLLLIDACSLSFPSGFCVITGETGSGKTAIVHALSLLLGERLDSSLVRSGCSKGKITAVFSLTSTETRKLLEDLEIDVEDKVVLEREIFTEGKSRCFINQQAVSVSELEKVTSTFLHIVDQSSSHILRQASTMRSLLDCFGGIDKQLQEYSVFYTELQNEKETHKKLEERLLAKEREYDFYQTQASELSSLPHNTEEEEEIFQDYTLHIESQEKVQKAHHLLAEIETSTMHLQRAKQECSLPFFQELFPLIQTAACAQKEAIHLIEKMIDQVDIEPEKLALLEHRLSTLAKLRKKYGHTLLQQQEHAIQVQNQIALFDQVEIDIEESYQKIKTAENKVSVLAQEISDKRKETAQTLIPLLEQELSHLHMEKAKIRILIEEAPLSCTGKDLITLLFQPNEGELFTEPKECASGGELSRLLLAFTLVLAEKNQTPTLVFDEIDANVGGTTARAMGERLAHLSLLRQVLCITHFPQVARQATVHFSVQKSMQEGRTCTTIARLDSTAKSQELLRMLGEAPKSTVKA